MNNTITSSTPNISTNYQQSVQINTCGNGSVKQGGSNNNLPAVQTQKAETPGSETERASSNMAEGEKFEHAKNENTGIYTHNAILEQRALAEREREPLKQNESVKTFGDSPEALQERQNLLRNCPQDNPVSQKNGNGKLICGGAAIASGIVLDSKNPEAAKANAQAIKNVCNSFKDERGQPRIKLSPDEETALKHLEGGNMSPKDVENLQQTMYKITQNVPGQGQGGVDAGGITAATTLLRSQGAFQGSSSVTFHNNRTGDGDSHWTTTVDGTHVNTMPEGLKGRSVVTGGPHGGPPSELGKNYDGSRWDSEVSFTKGENTKVDYKTSDTKYKSYEIGPDKYKDRDLSIAGNEIYGEINGRAGEHSIAPPPF